MILSATTACYLMLTGFSAGPVEHDLFGGADFFRKYSFENDEDRDFNGVFTPLDIVEVKAPMYLGRGYWVYSESEGVLIP